ncbi:MAG TPA: class I SAM-dependent methyltransferase, partial [Burkholderiaceae bacterium]|nr:class I SAM-dependent methyltransferase [Burkholderiaceae bacterium]
IHLTVSYCLFWGSKVTTWDPIWEKIFQERKSWGQYPPEELVRFFAQSYYQVPDRTAIKVLEVGCGPGGGPAWFIAREGFSYTGIDGSSTATTKAKTIFSGQNLQGEFVVGDLAELPWPDNHFDCVVDIASLQCNSEEDTQRIVSQIHRVMKPGGKHFSISVSCGTWGDGSGEQLDPTTFKTITEGPLSGMGTIRFATRQSMLALYSEFNAIELNYSIRSMENASHEIKHWVLTCVK